MDAGFGGLLKWDPMVVLLAQPCEYTRNRSSVCFKRMSFMARKFDLSLVLIPEVSAGRRAGPGEQQECQHTKVGRGGSGHGHSALGKVEGQCPQAACSLVGQRDVGDDNSKHVKTDTMWDVSCPGVAVRCPAPGCRARLLRTEEPPRFSPASLSSVVLSPRVTLGAAGGERLVDFGTLNVASVGPRSDSCTCSTSSWAPARSPCPRPLPPLGGLSAWSCWCSWAS